MLLGRLRLPGLLMLLLLTAPACTSSDAPSGSGPVGVAVPSYTPRADAPDFCTDLARGTDLRKVPAAMGTLVVTPDDVAARLHLGNAADEVRGVLDAVRHDGGQPDVESALDDLATALETATDGTVTSAVRADVVSALDEVGHEVQPGCGFPV
jgi:hypothetical protein